MVNNSHKGEDFIEASMTCARVPPQITGHVWQKSPSIMIILPPNGRLHSMTVQHTSSTHARTARFTIGPSSQIITEASFISSPHGSVGLMGDRSILFLSFTGT